MRQPEKTGPWRLLAHRAAVLVVCFLFPVFAYADACVLPDVRTNERPGVDGPATQVHVSVKVVDFMGVDDVNQQLEIDFFSSLTWTDPRLAASEGCRFNITDVWFPRLRFLNSSNLRKAFQNARDEVSVGPGGLVSYDQRFTGSISSYHNLRRFPFDNHAFQIELGAFRDSEEEVRFVADPANTWISPRLNIEGWAIGDIGIETKSEYLKQADKTLSIVVLSIEAKRDAQFFIYRFLLLLVFVVGMSWVIFWVPPRNFEFQIGIGATSMLTAIAFNISIAGQLPPLGYLTVLDRMLIWATMLVFLAIVEALITGRLVLAGRENLANRIDYVCRFVFPLLLPLGWFLIYMDTFV